MKCKGMRRSPLNSLTNLFVIHLNNMLPFYILFSFCEMKKQNIWAHPGIKEQTTASYLVFPGKRVLYTKLVSMLYKTRSPDVLRSGGKCYTKGIYSCQKLWEKYSCGTYVPSGQMLFLVHTITPSPFSTILRIAEQLKRMLIYFLGLSSPRLLFKDTH